MYQMIRNRDKGVRIKFRNPMSESHGLDTDKKSHPRQLILTNRMAWDTHQGCCSPACSP
jgi:hypothetical protein